MDPPFIWITPCNPPDIHSNFDDLCRLCGSVTLEGCRFNLFDNNGRLLDLRNKIENTLQLNVRENDGLPKVTCIKCSQNLENFFRFKTNCEKTAHALLNMACSQSQQNVAGLHYHFLANTQDMPSTSTAEDQFENVVIKKEVLEPEETSVTNDSEVPNEQYLEPCTKVEEQDYPSNPLYFSPSENFVTTSLDPSAMSRKKKSKKVVDLEKVTKKVAKPKEPKAVKDSDKPKPVKDVDKPKPVKKLKRSSENDKSIIKSKGKFTDRMEVNCALCSKVYKSRASIRAHIMCVHLKNKKCFKRLKCKYCKKYLKGTNTLSAHIKRYHTFEFKCICSYCGQGFINGNILEYHVRVKHTKERPFQCTQCERTFTMKHLLSSHMYNIHNEEDVKVSCDICNKIFANYKTLHKHKQIHNVPIEIRKKFKCTICGSGHMHRYGLDKHMKTHTGERPFQCDMCDKCYGDKACLRVHMLTHTGERKHVCEVCGSAFALPGTLRMHRLTVHEGIKMYKCNDCDKSYTQNKNLNIHLRNTGHTKPKRASLSNL